VICPRCRHLLEEPEGVSQRCPNHPDTVMVSPEALADADGDPFIGMVVAGRYAVLELLGAGSMGTVYRAHQEAMHRDVALKIVRSERLVDPQAKGRFQQEARATSLLTSVHTVTVFDFGEVEVEGDDPAMIDGSLFLAMELLDGDSLGERLKRAGRMHPEEAVKYVRHALMSLGEAHDKGVIHRDLKPDNLLLLRDAAGEEMCKVLDFGIAKLLTQDKGVDALETQAGTVFGTPRYMSPEQAQGKQLDARSDLYSLGVILYHMLLGKPPYTDGDAVVVMAHHIKTVPKRPTAADPTLELPKNLEDLLMRVLDKDPDKRPQSASEFIAELDALGPLTTTNASAQMAAVVDTRDTGRSRRVMFIGAGAAAAIGLVAAVAVTSVSSEAPTVESGSERQGARTGMADVASAVAREVEEKVEGKVEGKVQGVGDVRGEEQPEAVAPAATGSASNGVGPAAPSASGAPVPASSVPTPSPVRSPGDGGPKPSPPRPKGYEKFD
jgi:serine/threonine-protein kinase